MTETEKKLRQELANSLDWRRAHATMRDVVEQIPAKLRGAKPGGAPHSLWELLEHLRICQQDIVDYCQDAASQSPPFPEGYWPVASEPGDEEWEATQTGFFADIDRFREHLLDPEVDLFSPPPGGKGPSLLHEAILLVDHNAYHLGQMVMLLRLLERWKEKPIDYEP